MYPLCFGQRAELDNMKTNRAEYDVYLGFSVFRRQSIHGARR